MSVFNAADRELNIVHPANHPRVTISYEEEEAWLVKYIERAKYQHSVQLAVTVTPALAHALLARNKKNRTVNREKVSQLVAAIGRGEWMPTHQGIALNTHGQLHDGQHRLLAIIASGTPCMMDLHFGIDPQTFDRIDVGHMRTVANTLEIAGVKNAVLVGSMVRVLFSIENGRRWTHGQITGRALSRHLILDVVRDRPDLQPSADIATAIRTSMKRVPSVSGLGAAIFLVRKRMGPFEPADFFENVRTGLKAAVEDDPVYRLRQRLMQRERGEGIEHAAIFIKAYNAMLEGRAVKLLRWTETEAFPEVAA